MFWFFILHDFGVFGILCLRVFVLDLGDGVE